MTRVAPPAPVITDAAGERDLDDVRRLMAAFADWQRERYADHRDLVDDRVTGPPFGAEVAGLPGAYAPPLGALLIARVDGEPAGCGAMRHLDAGRCEIRRVFVADAHRGAGMGRALVEALIDRARGLGYRTALLDTGTRQVEARGLYGRLGFREIPPYRDVPADLREWLVFMERAL